MFGELPIFVHRTFCFKNVPVDYYAVVCVLKSVGQKAVRKFSFAFLKGIFRCYIIVVCVEPCLQSLQFLSGFLDKITTKP